MKSIYLDYAAATPVDSAVVEAMAPYLHEHFFNPSATYLAAKAVRTDIEAARAGVAAVLGARSAEVYFTAGATEANNVAIHGVMQQFPGKKLLVSQIEHESVLAPARLYRHVTIPVTMDGIVDTQTLGCMIDDETVLISVMYANNEVGTVQPIRAVSAIIQSIRDVRRKTGNNLPLYLHTDAAQAANYLDIHVSRLGADLLTLNGGKIYGPKQTGALFVKTGIQLTPLVYGGGQEHGLRSGTENVAGIAGFAAALKAAQDMRHGESKRLQELQALFVALCEEKIPSTVVNGSIKLRLPNNVHITIPGQDNERMLMALDEAGIMAAAGSACSASDEEPSHVLKAMGISDVDAQASLRFTFGRQTTEHDIRRTASELARIIA